MNRYLIVVFCVLTGCAAAIPMANAEELTVDRQLFIEWCNDHIQDFDENLSSPILAQEIGRASCRERVYAPV